MIIVLWKGAQPGTWSMGATKSARAWDILQVCEYLRQQSHAMPLLHLMTSTNPKMDWYNTLLPHSRSLLLPGRER